MTGPFVADSPDVAAAKAHARRVLEPALPPSDRRTRQGVMDAEHIGQVQRIMDRNAETVPLTVQRLEGIIMQFKNLGIGGTMKLGSYQPERGWGGPLTRDRAGRRIYLSPRFAQNETMPADYRQLVEQHEAYQREGYTASSDMTALEYTMAHEFGHHVMRMITFTVPKYPNGVDELLGVANARVLLAALDEHLGTDFMLELPKWTYRIAGNRQVASLDYLDKTVARNGKLLALLISKYAGSGSFHEMMAEIWTQYTDPTRTPPPEIVAVGRVMARLAEKGAKELKPS